jgi:hypothetical protein
MRLVALVLGGLDAAPQQIQGNILYSMSNQIQFLLNHIMDLGGYHIVSLN